MGAVYARRLPLPIAQAWAWQDRAACRDLGTEDFYSPEAERGARRRSREARAKAVCTRCPVIVECRDFALAVGETWGVWGGLTADERMAQPQWAAASA